MEKKYVLFDNREVASYQDYLEYCEINERVPQAPDSDDYYDWANDEGQIYWDDFIDEVSSVKDPCVITGTLGLWYGQVEIAPQFANNLKTAIVKCASKCDFVCVTYNNGVYEVSASHHDGTNQFTIHKLSGKGIEKANRNGNTLSYLKPYMVAKFKEL